MDGLIPRLLHWHCLLCWTYIFVIDGFFTVLGIYFIIVNHVFTQTRILLAGNISNLKTNTLLKIWRWKMRDFRLPSRCKWDMHTLGILRSVECYFLTDVSGQPISPIFKRQTWPLKMGPIGCPATSVRTYRCTLRKIPKEWRSQGGRYVRKERSLMNFCFSLYRRCCSRNRTASIYVISCLYTIMYQAYRWFWNVTPCNFVEMWPSLSRKLLLPSSAGLPDVSETLVKQ